MLTAEEARDLLDSIETVRKKPGRTEEPALAGLRDRALIAVMVYAFARVNAVLQMKVCDYLERLLDEYTEAAGIAVDPDGPLFRTAAGNTGTLTARAMWQQDAYRMIQRRAADAGIKTRIGNHTFRATGITAYRKNNGKLEIVQHIANTKARAERSFTTADRMRFPSMRSSGLRFEAGGLPDRVWDDLMVWTGCA